MSAAEDQTTTETPYPEQQELIGEPTAVAPVPEVDSYTRDVMAGRHRAGDSIADLADDYGLDAALVLAAIEQAPEQTPAPRRRHRWDLLGGSFVVGDETSTIERLRCRRCGLQARRVPTRTGGSLRLEVLPDGATEWTRELAECPGEQEQIPDQRILEKVDELEHQVEGLLKEIEIRGQLLDRVKAATGETWWHGAVELVERLQAAAVAPTDGKYRSLIAGWHRKSQEVDHWQAKYERQLKHSRHVEAERNRALDEGDKLRLALSTLREERRRIQWGSTSLADEAEQELRELRAEVATLRAAPSPATATAIQRRVPPLERQGTIKRFDVGGVHGYLTIGHYPDGAPCEVFLAVAKDGSTIRGLLDGWARMFSLALQYGVPLDVLVEKVKGARFEPSGWTDDPEITPAASILDYVVRWIERRYLPAPAAEVEPAQGEQP